MSLGEFMCVFIYQNYDFYLTEFHFSYIYTFDSVSENSARSLTL